MDEFKKKVHEEFDEAFDAFFAESDTEEWYAKGQIKAFLDTTLDNLLVEVEGLVPEEDERARDFDRPILNQAGRVLWGYYAQGWNYSREAMIEALTRFKGEDSKV